MCEENDPTPTPPEETEGNPFIVPEYVQNSVDPEEFAPGGIPQPPISKSEE